MTLQYSTPIRDARNDAIEATIGATAKLYLFSGAEPANPAAADPAGLLATLTLPADWMAASSGGVKAKAGAWTGSGSAGGTAASFRIKDNGGTTCGIQGTVGQALPLTTNGVTAANSNVLHFASTTGVAVGMAISGTGIVPGSHVLAFDGTTVTMDMASTAGVGSGVVITFGGDLNLDNPVIAVGQAITINTFGITDGNA